MIAAIASAILLVALVALVATGPRSLRATRADATPCAAASPLPATELAATACPFAGPTVGLGTPAAAAGTTVELSLSSDQAGPVTLTVRITEASGSPVSDATVVVKARHLDMDMGEFPHEALPTAPGVYTAERVGMGMGGHWRVEVDVARPGHDPVAAFFLVTMEGLA